MHMFEKLKYLVMALSLAAVGGGLCACDDDEQVTDEWTSDYVYLEHIAPAFRGVSFDLQHSSAGITGDKIWMPVTVRLSHPRKTDVAVTLSCSVDGGLPAEDVTFREGGSVVIRAGETLARDTVDVVSQWSFVGDAKAEYAVTVGIGAVKPAAGDLRVSTKQAALKLTVNKAEKADVTVGTPSGHPIADYTGWQVYASAAEGIDVGWGAHKPLLIDGIYNSYGSGTYVWYNAAYLGIKIDMGTVRPVTGLATYAPFGTVYAMSSCAIYTSQDGNNWKQLTPEAGLAVAANTRQNIRFVVPQTARYIIWQMHGSSCLSSEIWVYEE